MAHAQTSGDDDDDLITEINMVPFVDIALVLLIIFMLTADLIATPAIEVELPKAATGAGAPPTTVAVTLAKTGELFLNGAITDESGLQTALRAAAKADPKTQAVIAADTSVSHGAVVRVIDLVRQSGVFKFAINIDPQAPTP